MRVRELTKCRKGELLPFWHVCLHQDDHLLFKEKFTRKSLQVNMLLHISVIMLLIPALSRQKFRDKSVVMADALCHALLSFQMSVQIS